ARTQRREWPGWRQPRSVEVEALGERVQAEPRTHRPEKRVVTPDTVVERMKSRPVRDRSGGLHLHTFAAAAGGRAATAAAVLAGAHRPPRMSSSRTPFS